MKPSAHGSFFADLIRQCHRQAWVVYAKRRFGGPEHALHYLGNYTHRVAISNHRLIGLADQRVHFRWRDSAHKNKRRIMSLQIEEFLRRFFLHVLPRGFVRIRHFGFLANRRRQHQLALCRTLLHGLAAPSSVISSTTALKGCDFWRCPVCGGTMVIVERVTSTPVYVRPPPGSRETF